MATVKHIHPERHEVTKEPEIMTRKARLLLGAILYVWPGSAQASAESSAWQKSMVARLEARYSGAEELSQAALKTADRCAGQDLRSAANLNNLAEAYRKEGAYVLAEPLYQRSLAIWERTLGLNHPAVAVGLNNLALLYAAQGKYARAESHFQRSQTIFEGALGPDSLYMAISLENYAALLRQMTRQTEATKMEARAKSIRAKHTGDNYGNENMRLRRRIHRSLKTVRYLIIR